MAAFLIKKKLTFRWPELTLASVVALINLLGPLNEATKSLCKSSPFDELQTLLILPKLSGHVGRLLIDSCCQATWLMKDINLTDAVHVCDNLWSNLMNRMATNNDSTLTELIIQNLNLLAEAVSFLHF